MRTECCVLVGAVGLLAACSAGGASSAGPAPNPATTIAAPASTSSAVGGDWTMPTGVFRADRQEEGLLELHVEPGDFHLYEVTDGSPDLAYVATCIPDDPATVICTEESGVRILFAWSGTGDALDLTLPEGLPNDRAVWEGPPWTRVP